MTVSARLDDVAWLTASPLREVLAALDSDGEEARIAGGAVRDAWLGLPRGDIDVATTALPEETMRRARAAGWKAVPTGIDHGTVTVVAEGHPFEVTTLRRDVATDGRRAVVAYTRDWAEDVQRRDLTMNGLYLDRAGRIHDLVGGLGDLEAGRARFIGDARERIREDYLRILRFFRFHARFGRGELDREGFAAAVAERAGLATLSRERVRVELLKLLIAPRAAETLRAMAEAGLPGLLLGGAPRVRRFERMVELDGAGDALLRLAALAQVVAEDGERLQQRLRLTNAEAQRLAAIGDARPPLTPATGEAAAKVALYRLGRQAFEDRARLGWVDAAAAPGDAAWAALAALPERWTIPKPPFAASDFIARGVAPGPALGRALRAAEEAWIEAGFPAGTAAEALVDAATR
ncbi:poly(A) polymerase [Methylopila capsulata]|uniref:Poly(A) polymerase n=1 Tax=Methylopila capsulata TaxID=61654 RepID=A0A9W6IVQ4_9HYPH|nr:CCA tRNA nucleotidyltransferase [Methylopila capsulata]MBM7852288.1 poly(A) polymerase [Methylopila capsulata]GLK56497.1 poly(A) polymerase [Methylopila capsulata]